MSVIINKFTNKTGVDRLLKIRTFKSGEILKLLTDSLLSINGSICYFSDIGDILLMKNNIKQFYFVNETVTEGLDKDNRLENDKQRVFNIESNIVKSSTGKNSFFIPSLPYGKYVLYRKDESSGIDMLYNPIPRPEFASYYNQPNSQAYGLMSSYCKEVDKKDPICTCINEENNNDIEDRQYCMNDLLKTNKDRITVKNYNPIIYGDLEKRCLCLNKNCSDSHPMYKVILNKKYDGKGCPTSNITICSTNLIAGRDNNIKTLDIKQTCGGTTDNSGKDNTTDNTNKSGINNIDCVLSGWGSCINGKQTRTIIRQKTGSGSCPELIQNCKSSKKTLPDNSRKKKVIILIIILFIIFIGAYLFLE